MARNIESIEGIGPKLGHTFRVAGIKNVDQLLDAGADKSSRRALAERTGVSETRILEFVNMADLFRINGVASQYAELLEGAGVDTVKELKHRNAENLTAAMLDINNKKGLVRRAPSVKIVSGWITQAKSLPAKVSY